jgi:hypothetical protein
MHAGYHAGKLAIAVAKGEKQEGAARGEYQAQHDALFADLLRIVRYFYQQNLDRDDYFWESKRILTETLPEVKPQKAFMVLTSGLVRNLAFTEKRAAVEAKREGYALGESGAEIHSHDPEALSFVCLHLRFNHEGERVALYFLIEPVDPAAPSLFRTTNWHLNCLAPRYKNDPIRVPELAPYLRRIEYVVRSLDKRSGEPLASFWRRSREELVTTVRALAPAIELVRVFGE